MSERFNAQKAFKIKQMQQNQHELDFKTKLQRV
jgi:hypothetical protein